MRAVTFHGKRDLRVDEVPDPAIEEPTDAIVRITSTAICGSDLHLYEVLGMFMDEGDILGHEPMGVVEEVGPGVERLAPGDRVVVPFNISCGSCWTCDQGLFAQCETTQVREEEKGAALFGYTRLYGQVPGGQAEYLRVPQAHFGPIGQMAARIALHRGAKPRSGSTRSPSAARWRPGTGSRRSTPKRSTTCRRRSAR